MYFGASKVYLSGQCNSKVRKTCQAIFLSTPFLPQPLLPPPPPPSFRRPSAALLHLTVIVENLACYLSLPPLPLTPPSQPLPSLTFRHPSAVLLPPTVIVVRDMGEISKRLFGSSLPFAPLLLDLLLFLQECGERHRKNRLLQKYISVDNAIPKLGKLGELSFISPLPSHPPPLSFRRPSAVPLHLMVIVVRVMGEISKRLFGFYLSLSFQTSFRSTALSSRMRETASQERLQKCVSVDNAISKLGKLGGLSFTLPTLQPSQPHLLFFSPP
ncbi:hypothetical protein CDAR_111391 [Caerostris darwini]|uniref:Uncharacterized protein n=1 Tax=Caerostris darwini TaxID=1538125 RepID=A0AAV4WI77_9ARAC|nr:hypothetical protein CDAR_111391 [Caerostris darwini]